MKTRIEEVMSRIFSDKYDAHIKIVFKEREDEQRRDNHRTSGSGSNARKRNQKVKRESCSN